MGILSTLYSGITGLQTNGEAISVIGDNIANVNTVGFKSSRVEFESLLANQGNKQVGLGSRTSDVNTSFTQGSLFTTTKPTDLAISGDGFFVLNNGTRNLFTRNGQFRINEEGLLVNNSGVKVQGYQTDIRGNLSSNISDINLSNVSVVSQASTSVEIFSNLDASEEVINGSSTTDSQGLNSRAFNLDDPGASSNFSTGLRVFDSQGNSHQLTVYFSRVGNGASDNRWEWNAVVNTNEVDPAFAAALPNGTAMATNPSAGGDFNGNYSNADLCIVGQGTMEFDGQGRLAYMANGFDSALSPLTNDQGSAGPLAPAGTGFTAGMLNSSFDVQFLGGVEPMNSVTLNFGDPLSAAYTTPGTGLLGTTQFRLPSASNSLSQDGRAAGSLLDYKFEKDGSITGIFSNGESKTIGRVVVANFDNPNGLVRENGNLFLDTPASGAPTIGAPDEGGRGSIVAAALEQSNVDLSNEFVALIQHQRGFQANSRCISTSSDLLGELVNIVR